jgi:hypothetical protein
MAENMVDSTVFTDHRCDMVDEDIIPFAEKHQGKQWTHNNRRLVELSYCVPLVSGIKR